MPKIPTFTSTAQVTAQSPEIKTQFQVPLTGGAAGAVATGIEKINEFYVAKQNLQDSVEAKNKYYGIKGTTDTFFERQKSNYNEEDAIQNYTKDFNDYTKLELTKVANGNVRQKLKEELDLEFGQGILKIKKNSFDALIKEDTSLYNTGQTTDVAAYEENAGNPLEQYKFKDQVVRRAEQRAEQWKLSDIDKQLLVNGAKATLFLSDVKSRVMNSDNPVDEFKQLYENNNAQTFIKDSDLTKLVIETYKNKISNMAVAGDINSDYDKAVKLVNQVEKLTKPDGTKVITDKNLAEWNGFKEKIFKERGSHEELKLKANNDAEVVKFETEQNDRVEGNFYNKLSTSTVMRTNQDKKTAILATDEYKQRSSLYLSANSNADNATKKAELRDIANEVINKYEAVNIDKYSIYSKNNKVNYHFLFTELDSMKQDYQNNPSKDHPLVKEALKFGYKDKNGNADIDGFLLDQLPALKKKLQN
jgi:L-rhamnose mutarotase